MRPEVRTVEAERYMEDLLQMLDAGQQAPLVISGSSMDPSDSHSPTAAAVFPVAALQNGIYGVKR